MEFVTGYINSLKRAERVSSGQTAHLAPILDILARKLMYHAAFDFDNHSELDEVLLSSFSVSVSVSVSVSLSPPQSLPLPPSRFRSDSAATTLYAI
jgi:hypothetical protein